MQQLETSWVELSWMEKEREKHSKYFLHFSRERETRFVTQLTFLHCLTCIEKKWNNVKWNDVLCLERGDEKENIKIRE